MSYHEDRDARGIDHLVDDRGRCATFENCDQHVPYMSADPA